MHQTVMRVVPCAVVIVLTANSSFAAPEKKSEPPPLTAAGESLMSEYGTMLRALQGEITKAVPVVDPSIQKAFTDAHLDEGPKFTKVKEGSKQKPEQQRDSGVYKDFKRQKVTLGKARPVLEALDGFLGKDAIDKNLVMCGPGQCHASRLGRLCPAGS